MYVPPLCVLGLALYNLKLFIDLISQRQNFLKCIPMFQICVINVNFHHVTLAIYLCPKLQNFWNSFFKIVSDVLGVKLAVCPLIATFGVPSRRQPLSRRQADAVAFASLLARRRILLSWTSLQPPSISVWLKDLVFFLKLEKIKYNIRGRGDSFGKKWQKFITFFNDLPTLDVD